ncbi:hypothetical protein ABT275_33725 [Streptomyces sp. NPDC001185]|uniref:hypothetical protein n=1 Tax=Streptomyces sp. NPDC001185 TaxID=3154380 RepID=UPI00332392A6
MSQTATPEPDDNEPEGASDSASAPRRNEFRPLSDVEIPTYLPGLRIRDLFPSGAILPQVMAGFLPNNFFQRMYGEGIGRQLVTSAGMGLPPSALAEIMRAGLPESPVAAAARQIRADLPFTPYMDQGVSVLRQIAPQIGSGSFYTTGLRGAAAQLQSDFGHAGFRSLVDSMRVADSALDDEILDILHDLEEPAGELAGQTSAGKTWQEQRLAAAALVTAILFSVLMYAFVVSDAAKELADRANSAWPIALVVGGFVYKYWDRVTPPPPGEGDGEGEDA